MTWGLGSIENMPQEAVGSKQALHGKYMTGLDRQDAQVASRPKPLSDMQNILEDERKRHEQAYIYQHGHN